MAGVILTAALRAEYQRLFDSCVIRSDRASVVDAIVNDLAAHQAQSQMQARIGQNAIRLEMCSPLINRDLAAP
jgi:lysozyme family protein